MVNFKRFQFWGRNPLTVIEFFIAVQTLVGGIYVIALPLINIIPLTNRSALAITLTHDLALIGFGTILIVSALLMLFGIFMRKYRLRSSGLFLNILSRTYALIAGILINGLLPLTWLSSLVILLSCVVCYIVVRGFMFVDVDK